MKENRKSKIIRDCKWFGGSLYFAKLVHLPCSVITARLLGPTLYGTWSALNLILSYSSFLQLGVFDGLSREIPYLKGKGDDCQLRAIKESSFSYVIFVALGGMILLLGSSWFLEDRYSPIIINSVRIFAIIAFFYLIYGFYQYFLRGEGNFSLLGRTKAIYAGGASILQIIGVVLLGFYGLVLATLAMYIGIVFMLIRNSPISFKAPRVVLVRRLMKMGFPMLLTGMLDVFLYTTDRLIILNFLGRKELGYYAVALLAATFVDFIPTTIQAVLLPRIMRETGSSGTSENLDSYWLKPLYILSYALPIIVGGASILAPLIVLLILPQYLPGLLALKILIFGMCFSLVPSITRNFFVAVNKQLRVLWAFIAALAFNVVLNVVLVKLGWGIAGVAAAMSFTFWLVGILLICMALFLQRRSHDTWRVLVRVYSPVLCVASIVATLDMFFPSSTILRMEFVNILIRSLLYTISVAGLIYVTKGQAGLLMGLLRKKESFPL